MIAPSVDMDTEQKIKGVSLADYFDLFVGREDTYAKEILADNRRGSEQVLEPLTEERVREHLEGKSILETYVQRPNHTSKYMVFDIDISKRFYYRLPMEVQNFPVISKRRQMLRQKFVQF